ncbi:MAG TPA: TonB family protein [Bacteroidetes bacterium]|nr:TonB family protein [Bacteroidota bacterium]
MANEILTYLLKVSLGLTIISLSYLLLRNDYNLRIKRFYLLSGLIASWSFPFVRFPQFIEMGGISQSPVQPSSFVVEPAVNLTGAVAEGSGFNWLLIILIIYSAGGVFILFRNLVIIRLWRNKRGARSAYGNKIFFTDSNQAFTLFSWIFLPERYRNDPYIEPIILHERAHIRQLHFIDLIIVELTVLFTWFNPFTWLISRMIKENHEHLADREVLAGGVNPAHYRAQLLNFSLGTNYFRLGHQFSHSLTKTRFKMMKRTTARKTGIIKYLLMIPVIILALGMLTGSEVQDWDGRVKGQVIFADTGEPATGASIIVKGTTNGTTVDIDGRFELECKKDDILVISYVGYKTMEMKASWITGKPLELEFRSYELDLTKVKEKQKLELVEEKDKIGIRIVESDDNKIEPVIVVDGKVVEDYNNIDPEDIWSVEVIKDESSEIVKKYKAGNGVIIITLKEKVEAMSKVPTSAKATVDRKKKEEIFVVVEDMPQFPGGMEALKSFIYDNLEYPEKPKQEGIEGKVTVEFTVDTQGNVEDIKVVKSTYEGFDDAAARVFRDMPAWEPGKQRGHAVKVRLSVPVEFKLSEE